MLRNSSPSARAHLDKLLCLFLVVKPETIVDPEAQQFQRWLGTKQVVGWHIKVIQEAQQSLSPHRNKFPLGSLLSSTLHDGLDVVGGSLKKKILALRPASIPKDRRESEGNKPGKTC